jgi:peptide/nickel transport system substrate-binding protein
MRTKFSRLSGAALLLLAVLPASAETLRIGMIGDPATLDPAQSASVTDRVAFAAVCDKLIDLDEKLAYVPQLATGWAWSDDRLALTMTLRDGVIFHDGEPFDAKAVTVIDSRTVRIDLSEPYAPLIAQLADRAGMMVSPKAARALGDKLARHPVCAGPYKFAEWVAQDRIVFERFAEYWNAGDITFDKVIYLPIPDDTVRLADLRAGGLEIIERVSPSDIATLRSDPRVKLYEAPSAAYRVLSINTNKGPAAKSPLGSSAALREAFELSLDRTIINQVVFDGLFIPSNQPEAPGTPFYAAALPPPPRDLGRARALVAASGVARLPVNFLVSTDPLDQRVAQIIQAMAGEAGFDVKLEVTESASLLGRLKGGDYGLALLIWSGRPDPDANIAMWVACDGFINWGNYCDPRVDQILRQARSTTEVKERADLYAQAAAIYLAARPYLFLYHLKWLWGASAKLDGFVPHADGIIRLQGLRFKQ